MSAADNLRDAAYDLADMADDIRLGTSFTEAEIAAVFDAVEHAQDQFLRDFEARLCVRLVPERSLAALKRTLILRAAERVAA